MGAGPKRSCAGGWMCGWPDKKRFSRQGGRSCLRSPCLRSLMKQLITRDALPPKRPPPPRSPLEMHGERKGATTYRCSIKNARVAFVGLQEVGFSSRIQVTPPAHRIQRALAGVSSEAWLNPVRAVAAIFFRSRLRSARAMHMQNRTITAHPMSLTNATAEHNLKAVQNAAESPGVLKQYMLLTPRPLTKLTAPELTAPHSDAPVAQQPASGSSKVRARYSCGARLGRGKRAEPRSESQV